MFYYVPKLHHAMLTALICVGLIALCSKAKEEVRTALIVGALIFALMTGVVLWMLVLQSYDERIGKMIELAKVYAGLDEEARQAFAFQFPTMQYHMRRGEVRAYFEDTKVPIEMFRLFLQTSNDRYISPERDWCTAEMPRWAHEEIRIWLEQHGRIVPDSAAGNHSWLWSGNSYRYLMAYWTAGRKIQDMSGGEMVYAYDEPQPTLSTTPPS